MTEVRCERCGKLIRIEKSTDTKVIQQGICWRCMEKRGDIEVCESG